MTHEFERTDAERHFLIGLGALVLLALSGVLAGFLLVRGALRVLG